MSSRAKDALWIAGLTLGTGTVWTLLVSRIPRRLTLEAADLFVYFLPAYVYEAGRLHALALPLWNPYQETGVPFLATLQPGALYPARALLFLTDAVAAMAISNVAHLVLLVVATYALCRVLGARPAGAAVAATVLAVASGRPVLFSPSFLESSAWLPVAALAAERVIVTGRWRWVVLLGVTAALPILAGGYQVSVYIVYALAVFVLAILADRRRRGERGFAAIVTQLTLSGALALALAAPQLLPTLSWSAEAVRQTAQLKDIQIEPWRFLGWRDLLFVKLWQLTVPAAFLALVGFAASGIFGAVLGVAAGVGLMLSLGPGAPGFGLYRLLPAFGMFRGPGRIFTILVAFWCAVAVAPGFDTLLRVRWLARGWLRPIAEAVGVGLMLAVLVPRMRNDAVLPWTSTQPAFRRGMPGMFPRLRQSDGRVALFGYPGDWAVTARQGMMQEVPVLTDYEPLASRRLRDYLRVVQGTLAEDGTNIPFVGSFFLTAPLAHPELLDLVSVRHLVLVKGSPLQERRPPLVHAGDFAVYDLFTNPSALPRAYLVERARVAADAETALATLTEPGFDGRREAVIVGDDPETAPLRLAAAAPVRPARITVDEPERVAIEFETERDALLVLTDAFAPGWSVRVDGTSRGVRQVNHLVRGVVVHPGERRVEFVYRAPGFAAGVATAGLGVGTVALCATVGAWRRRRHPGGPETA
jgi:Bacterial membrane protein YfhO